MTTSLPQHPLSSHRNGRVYKKILKHRARNGCAESREILDAWHAVDSLERPKVRRFRKRPGKRRVAAFAPSSVLNSGDQLLFEIFKLIGAARRAYKGWRAIYCELVPDFINDRIRISVFIEKGPSCELRIGGYRPNFPIVTCETPNYPVPERTIKL